MSRKYTLYYDETIEVDLKGYMRPNDTLRFGKHKGKLLKEIMKEDPSYIKWALDNKVIKIYK